MSSRERSEGARFLNYWQISGRCRITPLNGDYVE